MITKDSPNHNERNGFDAPRFIILHYTGTTHAEADRVYMTPDQVSPHYMIDTDGSVTQYVDETKRAWHAGKSSWDGIIDINSASIGIEIVNGGHDAGLPEFPRAQMDAVVSLIRDIRSRWNINDADILGHSDIAPGRKIDPGENFPWGFLSENGIGLMPDKTDLSGELDTMIELYAALKAWGYDYTDDIDVMITEFRRHYLPDTFGQRIDDAQIYCAVYSLQNKRKAQTDLTSLAIPA